MICSQVLGVVSKLRQGGGRSWGVALWHGSTVLEWGSFRLVIYYGLCCYCLSASEFLVLCPTCAVRGLSRTYKFNFVWYRKDAANTAGIHMWRHVQCRMHAATDARLYSTRSLLQCKIKDGFSAKSPTSTVLSLNTEAVAASVSAPSLETCCYSVRHRISLRQIDLRCQSKKDRTRPHAERQTAGVYWRKIICVSVLLTIHVLSFDGEPSKQTHNVTMTTVSLVKSRSTHAKSINLPLRRQSVTLIYRV